MEDRQKTRLVLLNNCGKEEESPLPIILVPGFFWPTGLDKWKRILRERGFFVEILKVRGFLPTQRINEQAILLQKKVQEVLEGCDKDKCHLIGFSMGSVVILYFLQKLGGGKFVKKCILAIAPFNGIRKYLKIISPLFNIFRGLKELLPGSELLYDLVCLGDREGVEIYTLRGKRDMLCSEASGHLPFAINLNPIETGHAGIYFASNEEAVQTVIKILKK